MDEELKRHLDGMMAQINSSHERILNRITALEKSFGGMRRALAADALELARRWIDRLED